MQLILLLIIVSLGLIASLGLSLPAYSQEKNLDGTVGANVKASNVNGSNAKYHEYSDDRSAGVFGDVNVKYDSPGHYMEFNAKDPGYDTQHYKLEGNSYGKFKYWFDYNEIIHNITTGAKSFYNNVGSNVLTGTAGTNSNAWPSTFDYYTKRKKFDTGVDFKLVKPFFFDINYTNEKKEGIKPIGAQLGSTAGNFFAEIPQLVDYQANNVKLEGGYAKNPFFFSLSYIYSNFSNQNTDLIFTNELGAFPAANRGDRFFSLPADSKMHKFAFKGSVKLPMNSKFSVNLGESWTKSETSSFASFNGKVDTRNYDLTFTANPLRFLEGKLFYKYYDRDNRSTSYAIPDVYGTGTVATNPLSYSKYSYGGDFGFRLPAKLHLNMGYKRIETHRKTVDEIDPNAVNLADILPYNTDNIYFIDLKWTGLDFMTAKVSYERLSRGADFRNVQSRNYLFRMYSYAAQDKDTFKASFDLFPTDNLNMSFEYNYKTTNYNDTMFGVTGDKRNSFSFSGDYAFRKLLRFSTYFDAEKATLDQLTTTSAATGSPQWKSTLDEITYGYGVKTEIYAIPKKLTFILQGDYIRNQGNNDFTFYGSNAQYLTAFQLPAGGAGLPVDIPNVDSYQKYSLRFVTAYNWSNAMVIKAGYVYDRYNYSDAQLNGYQYIVTLPTAGSPTTGYLTGANANPSYSVNTVFLAMTYQF